jgi:protocatechuate 3,4-dioxygenase beta subunit
MRLAIILAAVLALALCVEGQNAESPKEPAKCSFEGTIVKDPDDEPIKKAIIEMIGENQGEGGNYTATSDAEGRFKIADILPGRYRVVLERTGYVGIDKKRRISRGWMLSIEAGQEIKDQKLHMLAAAIVTGRVLDEDGDPMASVDVTVLRRKGKSFEPMGSAQTNDLGEYRIGGLLAGKYYLSAAPLPNFQMFAMRKTAEGKDTAAPRTSYLRTFYPGVVDRAQASTIELKAGQETPMDFSLSRRHAASVRGKILGLVPGTAGVVTLRSKEPSVEFNSGDIGKDGKFEILNVAPGSYRLTAMTFVDDKPHVVSQPLEVGASDIEDVEFVPQPPAILRGRVRFSGKSSKPEITSGYVFLRSMEGDDEFESGVTVNLDETTESSDSGKLKPDGSFELKNVRPGSYELVFASDSLEARDNFVESVTSGMKEFVDTGLKVNGGMLALDVVVSAGAGVIEGVVTGENKETAIGSAVVAVPEARFRKQALRYARAETDQNGRFAIRGLRPGTYTLSAWESMEEGDEYLDPDFLKAADEHGTAVKVEKSSHQSFELKVIPTPADQP